MDVFSRDPSGKPTFVAWRESPGQQAEREGMQVERRNRANDVARALQQHWAEQRQEPPRRPGPIDRIRSLFRDRRGEGRTK
jgi:hypothetical protein